MLTPKQLAYANARVSGAAPSEAYRLAYSAERMTPKAISVEAARLESHPSVSLAITSAHQRVAARAERGAADISRAAWRIIENDENPASARVAALNLEAKRFPEYSEKHEVTGDLHVRMEALAVLATATPEQLRALAEGARG